jgi:hypothetical protein
MKKGLLGLIGVFLVSGFFMACDTGTGGGGETNPTKQEDFEGTWKNQFTPSAVLIFTSNNWSYQYNASSGISSGTFTFTDTAITFTQTTGNIRSWVQGYTLTGNKLELAQMPSGAGGSFSGPFTKQ